MKDLLSSVFIGLLVTTVLSGILSAILYLISLLAERLGIFATLIILFFLVTWFLITIDIYRTTR